RIPTGSARSGPANRRDCAARRPRWPRVVPTRRACGSPGRAAWAASVEHAPADRAVSVDAPIAQERPVAAHFFDAPRVALGDQNFLAVVRGFRDHLAEGLGHERAAPEFQAVL